MPLRSLGNVTNGETNVGWSPPDCDELASHESESSLGLLGEISVLDAELDRVAVNSSRAGCTRMGFG